MSFDDFELNQNDYGKISVKKSTFNGLIIGLVIVVEELQHFLQDHIYQI